MKYLRKSLTGVALSLAFWGQASAETIRIESPGSQATLVELFTSEGCSSCPPADRWLSELKTDPRLWRDLVPVAFHVDYWNYLGWRDRFSAADYSQRQRDYARHGLVRTVYTPGFVVNGEEWRGWFRRPDLQSDKTRAAGQLTATVDEGTALVRYLPEMASNQPLTLHITRLGFDLATQVEDGENNGRLLKHDFVVLGHAEHELKLNGSTHERTVELPPARISADREAVAIWVTRHGDPRPLQAAGGWIN